MLILKYLIYCRLRDSEQRLAKHVLHWEVPRPLYSVSERRHAKSTAHTEATHVSVLAVCL